MERDGTTPAITPALEIQNLTKVYLKGTGGWFGRKKREIKAVDELSLQIMPGEVFGFLGLNGAGKTTTMKSVLGFIRPTSGSVRIFGVDGSRPEARSRVGFAPERSAFYDHLTCAETLEMLGGIAGLGTGAVREKIPVLLSLVALGGEADTVVRDFSKGMQQRLGIAQSLLGEPSLFIFDEPTTGLDPFGRRIFKDLVLRLKADGRAVFFSSHQIPDVQEICDKVGVIHRGRLVHQGPVAELIEGGKTLEHWFIDLLGKVDPFAKSPIQLD